MSRLSRALSHHKLRGLDKEDFKAGWVHASAPTEILAYPSAAFALGMSEYHNPLWSRGNEHLRAQLREER